MNKFTSKQLMKSMKLQVGDRVKVTFEFTEEEIFEITESVQGTIYLQAITDFYTQIDLGDLIDKEFDILPRPKKVGDMLCKDFKGCDGCPLRYYSSVTPHYGEQTLYEILKEWLDKTNDQEIHDLLKTRLDKEVPDNE